MTAPRPDPLSQPCRLRSCRARAGEPCMTSGNHFRTRHRTPFHKVRRRDALAVAAHTDPALDAFGPRIGPCLICGVRGLPQRHRTVDAIAGGLAAGELPEVAAEEYGVTLAAVGVIAAWMQRWPGAWR